MSKQACGMFYNGILYSNKNVCKTYVKQCKKQLCKRTWKSLKYRIFILKSKVQNTNNISVIN